MADIVLLGLERSVYTRIARLALEEKSVEYTLEEVDIFADGGPPKDYLAHHPFGKIPCLLHGDFSLYETGAICRYIDEGFEGPALQPQAPSLRARLQQIVSVLDAYAYRPMVWDVFVQRMVIPEAGGKTDERVVSGALGTIDIVLNQLDAWLGDKEFLLEQSVTLADMHAFPMLLYFALTPEGETMLRRRPRLQRWIDCMRERPSVLKTASIRG